MTVIQEVLPSPVTDISGARLDERVVIGPPAYMRIMRRLGIRDGETVTPVSAFNSSI